MNINLPKKTLLAASFAVCLAMAGTVEAKAELTDLGELQNGVTYEFPGNFGQVQGYFIVKEAGKVQAQFSNSQLTAYRDPEHTQEVQSNEFAYINSKPTRTYYDFKVGETIYFYSDFVMNSGTITVTNGDLNLKLEAAYPSDVETDPDYYGGVLSITGDLRISLLFNLNVSVASATATVGSTTVNLSPQSVNNVCEVYPATTLLNMYKNGTLKGGDTVTFKFSGINEANNPSNKLGEDGTLTMSFVMAPQPIELVLAKGTPDTGMPTLLSYYLPDNPDAIVKFIFSGDINTEEGKTPYGQFTYGDLDNVEAGMYIEKIPATVEGNVVTFDFSGKLRRPVDMLPTLPEANRPDFILFDVSNIFDTNGQRIYISSQSNPYSLIYNYDLKILNYNVASDFTPIAANGIKEGDPMEIFIMDGAFITFSGVRFSYTANGEEAEVIVPLDQLSISADDYSPETDIVINLNVPTLTDIDTDSDITVTLADMACADGLDHSKDVENVYSKYTSGIEAVTAATGTNDVFNAQGVKIIGNASDNDLRNLPAGLYIVGNRKIIVR